MSASGSRRGDGTGRGDGRTDPRRASQSDRDELLYARLRAAQRRARARSDLADYDPAPPTDDDWTVPDEETDGLHRISRPTPVGDLIGDVLDRRGWRERLQASTASQRWADVVGEELAARCEPVRLAGGVLVVRAESQVWASQLRYMLVHLRERAETVLGGGTVREVRLVVGPLEGRSAPERE